MHHRAIAGEQHAFNDVIVKMGRKAFVGFIGQER